MNNDIVNFRLQETCNDDKNKLFFFCVFPNSLSNKTKKEKKTNNQFGKMQIM